MNYSLERLINTATEILDGRRSLKVTVDPYGNKTYTITTKQS